MSQPKPASPPETPTIRPKELETLIRSTARMIVSCCHDPETTEAEDVGFTKKLLEDFLAASASPQGWQPLDPENLPTHRVLLTNNLTAQDAYGVMSHVWYAHPIKASEPERTGPVVCYSDDDRLIHGLTHYASVPAPPVSDREETPETSR